MPVFKLSLGVLTTMPSYSKARLSAFPKYLYHELESLDRALNYQGVGPGDFESLSQSVDSLFFKLAKLSSTFLLLIKNDPFLQKLVRAILKDCLPVSPNVMDNKVGASSASSFIFSHRR